MFGLIFTRDFVYFRNLLSENPDSLQNKFSLPFSLEIQESSSWIPRVYECGSPTVFHFLFEALNEISNPNLTLTNSIGQSLPASKVVRTYLDIFCELALHKPLSDDISYGKTIILSSNPPLNGSAIDFIKYFANDFGFLNVIQLDFTQILAWSSYKMFESPFIHCHIGENLTEILEIEKENKSNQIQVKKLNFEHVNRLLSKNSLNRYLVKAFEESLSLNLIDEISENYFQKICSLLCNHCENERIYDYDNDEQEKHNFLLSLSPETSSIHNCTNTINICIPKEEFEIVSEEILANSLQRAFRDLAASDWIFPKPLSKNIEVSFSFDNERENFDFKFDLLARVKKLKSDGNLEESVCNFELKTNNLVSLTDGLHNWYLNNLYPKLTLSSLENFTFYVADSQNSNVVSENIGIGFTISDDLPPYFYSLIHKNQPINGVISTKYDIAVSPNSKFNLKLYEGSSYELENCSLIYDIQFEEKENTKLTIFLNLHSNFLIELLFIAKKENESEIRRREILQFVPRKWKISSKTDRDNKSEMSNNLNSKITIMQSLLETTQREKKSRGLNRDLDFIDEVSKQLEVALILRNSSHLDLSSKQIHFDKLFTAVKRNRLMNSKLLSIFDQFEKY